MPRRSAEWSTASSCTSVARCISSSTAASVLAGRLGMIRGRARQEHQRRPEQFPLHPQQMVADSGDERRVIIHDAPQLGLHLLQPLAHRRLHVGQRHRLVWVAAGRYWSRGSPSAGVTDVPDTGSISAEPARGG